MRLDKYLKVSRIVKRRSVANEICDAGRVVVNGKEARASLQIKAGDIVNLTVGLKTHTYEVISTVELPGKDSARAMSRRIDEEVDTPGARP